MSNKKPWHPSMIAGGQGFTSNPDGSFTLWDTDGKQHRYVPESAVADIAAERDRLAAELAELRAQKPVAWRWLMTDGLPVSDTCFSGSGPSDHIANFVASRGMCGVPRMVQKLYAAPVPAAVPSTTEETIRTATQYAHDLVVSLHRDHYQDNNSFEPFDDLLGLLSQIDNMICGWKEPAAVPDGLVDTLRKFNAWRKGEIHEWNVGMHSGPDPQEITKAIDTACAILSSEATVPAQVPDGYTPVKTDTVLWLLGEKDDFECPPGQFFRGKPAPYFWRRRLRADAMLAAAQKKEGE